jgi:hypothetical protein
VSDLAQGSDLALIKGREQCVRARCSSGLTGIALVVHLADHQPQLLCSTRISTRTGSNTPWRVNLAPAAGMHQAARRRTSQMVAAIKSRDSASSQPPSIHWNGQNRLPGW